MKSIFPHPSNATEDGLLTVGGFINTKILLDAYSNGIFPWPISIDLPLAWFSPDPRGIIDLTKINLSKNLIKSLRNSPFEFKINHNFHAVIQECAKHHSKNFSTETWITPEIIEGYCQFYQDGHAYSAEAYENNELVGGLYGVQINGYFSGESMFFKKSNASKFALYHLLVLLQQNQIPFLDTQMVTPITQKFGAIYISRKQFLEELKKSLQLKPKFRFNE